MTWRKWFAPIIDRILQENKGEPIKEVRKALRDAWRWGPRKHHPYKIWLNEIRIQLGEIPRGRKYVTKPKNAELESLVFLNGWPNPELQDDPKEAWLVFADWLEMQGCDDDAKLIRECCPH